MWHWEVFCVALFGKIWERCNNRRRKRFPCLTRCLSKTSLFIYDIQDSLEAQKILIINIFQEFDLFCRFSCWHTHDWWEDEMQKMKSYLALSGCPSRAPCQESFILSETCSPQIGRKTLDRQTQGQLPCLVCPWRSAIVETLKLSSSCLNIIAK